jgi:hypothetical protein
VTVGVIALFHPDDAVPEFIHKRLQRPGFSGLDLRFAAFELVDPACRHRAGKFVH